MILWPLQTRQQLKARGLGRMGPMARLQKRKKHSSRWTSLDSSKKYIR